MQHNYPHIYPYSFAEANKLNEVSQWVDSQVQNIMCKEAIEEAIRVNFDGFRLSTDCVQDILDRYGFKRVQHVLANTVMEKSDDGRFDPSNRAWAEKQGVMPDAEHNFRFAVDSHPAVVNGFLHVVRDAYSSLHLFEAEDCDTIWQELKGKVLVMKPSTLKESYWSQENQLWVATSGFGCSPSAVGRAVYATCLGDGEDNVRWNREDFLGVLKDELLPDWAREQLDKLNSGQKIGPVDAGAVQVMQ